jgi:hypothetical protein
MDRFPANIYQFFSARYAEVTATLMLIISGLKLTWGLEQSIDIGLYDESVYLQLGMLLKDWGISSENGPLYSAWYLVLSLLTTDKVNLYFLNYKISIVSLPILVYVFLRKSGSGVIKSTLLAWFILISHGNLYVWPRVSHFALNMILLVLIVNKGRKSWIHFSIIGSLGALILSYIRPEFFLSFIIFSLVFLASLVTKIPKQKKINLRLFTIYFLASFLLINLFNLPIAGNRSFVAFGQHFSINWITWTKNQMNPWTDWEEIIPLNFADSNNILEMLRKNPVIFVKHLGTNLSGMKSAPELILPVFAYTGKTPQSNMLSPLPTSNVRSRQLLQEIVIIVLFLLILSFSLSNKHEIKAQIQKSKHFIYQILLFMLPAMIASILIYPREHYLYILIVLFYLLLSICILTISQSKPPDEHNKILTQKILPLAFALFLITPLPFLGGINNQPVLQTIRLIDSLNINKQVFMLEAEGGFNIYLNNNFDRVPEYKKNEGFYQFLKNKNINLVIVSPALLNDIRFKDDPEWLNFLQHPHDLDFVKICLQKNDTVFLLLRKNLIDKKME